MRKLVLIIGFAFYSFVTFGQDTVRNTFIEGLCLRLEAGYSIPLNSRPENPEEAFVTSWGSTKGGLIFDLSADYRLKNSNFGLSMSYKHISSQLDINYLKSAFDTQAGYSGTITAVPWRLNAFMFGGYYQVSIAEKTMFRAALDAGLLSATSPKTTVSFPSLNSTYEYGKGNSLTIAVQPKIQLFYNLSQNLNLNIFGSLLAAPTKIKSTDYLNGNNLGTSTRSSNILALNMGLGITYLF